ncbi:MAG: HNH endonuclease [Clostridiaceae bacterium]
MVRCWMCNAEIKEENVSKEHIFLNAIGGKLRSNSLLCKTCNQNLGDSIDYELAEQLNIFTNLLDIRRDDGSLPPPIHTTSESGVDYKLLHGGKPELDKPSIRMDGRNIHIIARSTQEANKLMRGYKRKYPEIDVAKIAAHMEHKKRYLNEYLGIECELGGKARLSVCKTAINFYILKGGDRRCISHLIPYVQGCHSDDVVGFFYNHEVIQKNPGQIIHAIILIGNPDTHILYAYVEFFNAVRYIILLNDHYDAAEISSSYFFDVLEGQEVKLNYWINLTKEQIKNLLEIGNIPYQKVKEAFSCALEIITNRQQEKHLHEMCNIALEKSLMKYPEGEIITPEMGNELCEALMEELMPWLFSVIKDE